MPRSLASACVTQMTPCGCDTAAAIAVMCGTQKETAPTYGAVMAKNKTVIYIVCTPRAAPAGSARTDDELAEVDADIDAFAGTGQR
jgi:hypothetical protein